MTGAKYKENLDLMLHKDKEHANEETDANMETEDPQEKKSVLMLQLEGIASGGAFGLLIYTIMIAFMLIPFAV